MTSTPDSPDSEACAPPASIPAHLRVDPADLLELASRIEGSAAEVEALSRWPEPSAPMAGDTDSNEISRALVFFVDAWHSSLRDVVADTHRMAEAIRLIARDYDDAERLVDGLFHR